MSLKVCRSCNKSMSLMRFPYGGDLCNVCYGGARDSDASSNGPGDSSTESSALQVRGNPIEIAGPFPERAKTKKCPFCAEEILSEAKLCKHCGSNLKNPASTAPVQESTSRTTIRSSAQETKSKSQLLIIMGTILSFLLALYFIFTLAITDRTIEVSLRKSSPVGSGVLTFRGVVGTLKNNRSTTIKRAIICYNLNNFVYINKSIPPGKTEQGEDTFLFGRPPEDLSVTSVTIILENGSTETIRYPYTN